MPLQDVSGLQLLRRDIPPTGQVPRSGHTLVEHNGVEYLLQPEVVTDVAGTFTATICLSCLSLLRGGEVPEALLATIDPGPVPAQLPKLTIMESLIISLQSLFVTC